MQKFDDFTVAYLEAALWSSYNYDSETDENVAEHFDGDYDYTDIEATSYQQAQEDVERFIALLESLPAGGYDNLYEAAIDVQPIDHLGHNLWLTRAGHGAGFWDGGYGDYGDTITEAVHTCFGEYSEQHLFAQDGKVYIG